MRRSHLGILLGLIGCATSNIYWGNYQNVTSYKINTTYTTPKGIKVDDPKHELFPRLVDKMTDEVEACIAALPAKWTQAQAQTGNCIALDVPRNIDRTKLTVKVPPDWYTSPCSGEQEFKCDINQKLCDQKPETIGMPCPCACRATLQDGAVVTAPNMKLYKGELARLVTGCNNIWFVPLTNCAHTPTYPLVDPGP